MRARPINSLVSIVTALALAAVILAPAAARSPEVPAPWATEHAFAVYHGPVDVPLVTPGSDGHQPGDVRVSSIETTNEAGVPMGRLEATLTTTGIDVPGVGDEQRIGVLVFSFGEDGMDQVTVQGIAHYPAEGPTIATGGATVWPIVGGSGRFDGATGEAVTTHLEDGSWIHELRLAPARVDAGRLFEHRVVQLERRAERVRSLLERRARSMERAEARAASKADRKAARFDRRNAGVGDGAIDALYANVPDDGTGVVRTDLGVAEPGSAPGQELGLWHYVIPAGEVLAVHTHPGWQLARVTSGELEYIVDSGEAVVLRADGTSEPMGPGTYVLATGDGVIENPELVHYGANRTGEPVTLISATLFAAGEPISTIVELGAAATPAGAAVAED